MAVGGRRGARCTPCQRGWDATRNRAPSRAKYRDPAYRYAVVAAVCGVEDCDRPSTKDHIVEDWEGGANDASNLQPLCIGHNVSKSNDRRREARENGERKRKKFGA